MNKVNFRMKKTAFFLLSLYFICLPIAQAKSGSKKNKQKIHPSFKTLLMTYPRPNEIKNPQVPRVSPKVALKLYQTQRALFFAAGTLAHGHKIKGAIILPAAKEKTPSLINKIKKLQKKLENKYFIIFCA